MDPSTYAARREVLRTAVPDGAILIMGNDEAPRNYVDNVYPFRQDSHFLYYGGVSQAGLAMLIEPDGGVVLYGTPDHRDDVIWHGPHPTLADHAAAAGASVYADIGGLAVKISALRGAGVDVHYLPPYRAQRRFALARLLGADPREVGAQTSVELVRAVVAQRSIKEEREIDEIEDALAVTAGMYRATMRAASAGRSEAELAAVHIAEAIGAGCGQAFSPIVTVRGEVLHNVTYENTLVDGDLLLVDSGAEAPSGYASDITRTMPVSGRFTTASGRSTRSSSPPTRPPSGRRRRVSPTASCTCLRRAPLHRVSRISVSCRAMSRRRWRPAPTRCSSSTGSGT